MLQEANITQQCGTKTQMFISLIIGFAVGMALLSPTHEPDVTMAIASTSMGARPGSMQPLSAFQLRGPHSFVSGKVINPMIPHARHGGTWSAYTRPVVVRAESETLKKLEDAIKIAQECDGDCMVEWDNVEELSAAVAHSKPKDLKSGPVQLSEEDSASIKASMEKLAEARKKVGDGTKAKAQIDPKVMAQINAALEEKQEVVRKVGSERLTKFEETIKDAIATATESGSAVDWDIVEELMQERSHLKKFGGST